MNIRISQRLYFEIGFLSRVRFKGTHNTWQHANNPVGIYSWGDDVFAEAKSEKWDNLSLGTSGGNGSLAAKDSL